MLRLSQYLTLKQILIIKKEMRWVLLSYINFICSNLFISFCYRWHISRILDIADLETYFYLILGLVTVLVSEFWQIVFLVLDIINWHFMSIFSTLWWFFLALCDNFKMQIQNEPLLWFNLKKLIHFLAKLISIAFKISIKICLWHQNSL